jgi:hypothetical protein
VSPVAHSDGGDGFGLCGEFVPCVANGVDDVVEGFEDAVGEAYKSVTEGAPIEQLGPALLEERSALIRHLRRKQDSAEVTPEDEEEAQKEMDTVRVLYGDGSRKNSFSATTQ